MHILEHLNNWIEICLALFFNFLNYIYIKIVHLVDNSYLMQVYFAQIQRGLDFQSRILD